MKRKLIFNDDGGGSRIPRYLIRSVDEFLEQRARGLEYGEVDTVSFCTTAGTFGRFYHRSEVGETAEDLYGRYFPSVIPDLIEIGTDPLTVMVDHCHRQKKEIWWSLRMNDTHDASNELLVPDLKKNHPEYLLSTLGESQKYGTWSAVNYGIGDIRALAVSFVEEVLGNYQVDGIELDFFRHPVFFTSVARGGVAKESELAAMTEVVQQVHAAIKAAEQSRSHPLSLAIIIPDDIAYCRSIGLDIEAWLGSGIVDAVTTSGYFRLNPWEYSSSLGHRFDTPVYAGLQETRVVDESGKALRSSPPGNRGRIHQALAAGMTGISMYNAFNTYDPIFREAADIEALLVGPRYYFPCVRGIGRPAGRPLPYDAYMNIPTIDPDHPQLVSSGETFDVSISVPSPETGNDQSELRIRIRDSSDLESSSTSAGSTITVAVNRDEVPLVHWKGEWSYAPSARELVDGTNRISIENTGGREITIADIFFVVNGK